MGGDKGQGGNERSDNFRLIKEAVEEAQTIDSTNMN